jgi:hypothetical protein
VYALFRSRSAYARARKPIPLDAATVELSARYCSYTGYAPRIKGEALLRRLERARRILAVREEQWAAVYRPGWYEQIQRDKTLALMLSELAEDCPAGVRWDWLVDHGVSEDEASACCYTPVYLGTVPEGLRHDLAAALGELARRGRRTTGYERYRIEAEPNKDDRYRVYGLTAR